jgi:hypothetical protein
MIGEIETGTRQMAWDNIRALEVKNARVYGPVLGRA